MDPSLCNMTIQIPKSQRQALRAIAEREDRSLGSLIRLAIQRVLAEKGEAAPRRKGTASQDERTLGAICEPR